jgi:hypothetical protein
MMTNELHAKLVWQLLNPEMPHTNDFTLSAALAPADVGCHSTASAPFATDEH